MSAKEEATASRLSNTWLRDFGSPLPHGEPNYDASSYRITLAPQEAPIPVLLRHALALIGIGHRGPREKVAWWVTFTYKGYLCELAHQKFGLRLRIIGDLTEDHARDLLNEVRKKLTSAVKDVEGLLAETASDTLKTPAASQS